jgi:hypothetical protein
LEYTGVFAVEVMGKKVGAVIPWKNSVGKASAKALKQTG